MGLLDLTDPQVVEWGRVLREISQAKRRLREAPDAHAERIRKIETDPEVWPEAKVHRIRQVKDEYAREFQALQTKLAELEAEGRQMHRDLRVSRTPHQSARERARALLERDVAPQEILERAHGLGDDDLVAALSGEMLYWGKERGFADAEEVLLECDRALSEVAKSGVHQLRSRRAVEFTEAVKDVEDVLRYAAHGLEGKHVGQERVRMALATGGEE